MQTSVIIIGAGPAGAGASYFLTKAGIHHVVVDKAVFPRDKVCGDACSGKTALVIKRANEQWLNELLDNPAEYLPSWGVKFVAPNGRALDIPFDPRRTPASKAPGFTVPRLQLDDFLFRKMASPYCTIMQGAQVADLVCDATGAKVQVTHNGTTHHIEAPVLIGADGDKSIVRKRLLKSDVAQKSYAIGTRAYYEGVTGMHPENFIELHFLPEVLPGYLWIFPLPGGRANVGVGVLSEVVRDKKLNLREQMLHAIKNNPDIAPRFANATLTDKIHGWGLPLATERQPLSGDGFFLCGDAASLVDPFTGEGIGNALYSGMLAAMAIEKLLPARTFDAAHLKEHYDDVLYKRLGDEFRISTTLQRLSKYPWLFNFVVNKAYKSPSLRDTISCMFADIDLRGQLSKPSFYLKILFNR
jgi:geranylgeranyl reductase family protein